MPERSYLAHNVSRQDRTDGTIILSSGLDFGTPAARTTDWLDHWADATPDAVFLAERDGAGWRSLTFAQTRQRARSIAAALLDRDLGPDRPIMILSGNSVDHGLLTLAAQYVGIPTVPLAEQYALIPDARSQLDFFGAMVKPGLVYAEDGDALAEPLSRAVFNGVEKLVSKGGAGATRLDQLSGNAGDIAAANAQVTPDTVAKILMTSGSTSHPKGVLTTHRMMCTNQAQIACALPFLTQRAPRIVDWLPWNHVFGGSHNFNLMLANGGALYIDAGKPAPGLIDTSIENLRLMTGTIAFNVPVGFARLRDVMRDDLSLRQAFFEDLDMLFYAGASLPQDVWTDLEAMAREVRGDMPLFTSCWGLTETAPACILQYEPPDRPGIVGVPLPGVQVKLIPDADMRCEVRVKGPTIFKGYWNDPERSAEAFDDEGFFRTGDAMKFVDPQSETKGLRFDGRISEDFKLMTGTWVRAANLRLDLLDRLGALAMDVVITGADRAELGLLIVPPPPVRQRADVTEADGVLDVPGLGESLRAALSGQDHRSSTRITRALVLSDPPSMAEGEITAKGNLNFPKLLARRADLVARLYDNSDPAVIHL